jgi:Fe-S-cluster containining protein
MLARVRRAFAAVLQRQGYVSVVDVLVELQSLRPAHLEDWRFGRVPYLERVVQGNLHKLSLILREIRTVAEEQGLKGSETAYRKWGKGPKRSLRFSKYGDPHVERAYATHWVSRRGRPGPPRPAAGGEEEAPPGGRTAPREGAARKASPGRRRTVLQPGVPVERDPERVRLAADDKQDENLRLRQFLKWGPLSSREVDRLFRRLLDEVAAEIDCTECASCCLQISPVLGSRDVERLSRRLGVSASELEASHLRKTEDGLVFVRVPCPLLDGKRCSCYEDRPEDCRSYPHLHKKDMQRRLLDVLGNASLCPIVFGVLERLKGELREEGLFGEAGDATTS